MNALHAVRYRDEFEMLCELCGEWWPLTPEFWYPRRGLNRCTACNRDRGVEAKRRQRTQAQPRPGMTFAQRVAACEAKRRWYHRHSDEIKAKRIARLVTATVTASKEHAA